MHYVIYGAGAALAQPLIEKWANRGDHVTAVFRSTKPDLRESTNLRPGYRVMHISDYPNKVDHVDCLVTLTGAVGNCKLSSMDIASWDKVVRDNLEAPWWAIKHTIPLLEDSGNVVLVGSIVGSTGCYGAANYAAAKAGLVGLVRSAALELANNGVCVNLLELGYMEKGMGAHLSKKVREEVLKSIPLRRFGGVSEFVEAVEYLSTVRYMTGNVLTLAGGLR